jgi:hypothetical protein
MAGQPVQGTNLLGGQQRLLGRVATREEESQHQGTMRDSKMIRRGPQ